MRCQKYPESENENRRPPKGSASETHDGTGREIEIQGYNGTLESKV
jgi:hypothetical protein